MFQSAWAGFRGNVFRTCKSPHAASNSTSFFSAQLGRRHNTLFLRAQQKQQRRQHQRFYSGNANQHKHHILQSRAAICGLIMVPILAVFLGPSILDLQDVDKGPAAERAAKLLHDIVEFFNKALKSDTAPKSSDEMAQFRVESRELLSRYFEGANVTEHDDLLVPAVDRSAMIMSVPDPDEPGKRFVLCVLMLPVQDIWESLAKTTKLGNSAHSTVNNVDSDMLPEFKRRADHEWQASRGVLFTIQPGNKATNYYHIVWYDGYRFMDVGIQAPEP